MFSCVYIIDLLNITNPTGREKIIKINILIIGIFVLILLLTLLLFSFYTNLDKPLNITMQK